MYLLLQTSHIKAFLFLKIEHMLLQNNQFCYKDIFFLFLRQIILYNNPTKNLFIECTYQLIYDCQVSPTSLHYYNIYLISPLLALNEYSIIFLIKYDDQVFTFVFFIWKFIFQLEMFTELMYQFLSLFHIHLHKNQEPMYFHLFLLYLSDNVQLFMLINFYFSVFR